MRLRDTGAGRGGGAAGWMRLRSVYRDVCAVLQLLRLPVRLRISAPYYRPAARLSPVPPPGWVSVAGGAACAGLPYGGQPAGAIWRAAGLGPYPGAAARPPPPPGAAALPSERVRGLAQRFAAANVTHDGQIDPRAGRGRNADGGAELRYDRRGHKGYVTLPEIRAFVAEPSGEADARTSDQADQSHRSLDTPYPPWA